MSCIKFSGEDEIEPTLERKEDSDTTQYTLKIPTATQVMPGLPKSSSTVYSIPETPPSILDTEFGTALSNTFSMIQYF